jgi:ribose-phosphate pyrophosphokinase
VSEVAKCQCTLHVILTKIRHGDSDVEVSIPHPRKNTKIDVPVLVDDIISTVDEL